jgi:hypothetical protein
MNAHDIMGTWRLLETNKRGRLRRKLIFKVCLWSTTHSFETQLPWLCQAEFTFVLATLHLGFHLTAYTRLCLPLACGVNQVITLPKSGPTRANYVHLFLTLSSATLVALMGVFLIEKN